MKTRNAQIYLQEYFTGCVARSFHPERDEDILYWDFSAEVCETVFYTWYFRWRIASKVKRNCGHISPGFRTKAFFHIMRIVQKKGWNEADANYWNEKGWTGSVRPWK